MILPLDNIIFALEKLETIKNHIKKGTISHVSATQKQKELLINILLNGYSIYGTKIGDDRIYVVNKIGISYIDYKDIQYSKNNPLLIDYETIH